MKRLINSLAGAASDLSDYAADRVDDWAAGLRGEGIDTPEQPDEFDDDPEGWRDRAAIAESTLESTRESRDTAYLALDHLAHLADLVAEGHDLAGMGSDPNTVTGKVHAAIVRDRKRAADRIAELERQLDAHHEHEARVEEQLGIIARAIAGIPEADTDGDTLIGERVRAALLAVTGRARDLQNELNGMRERERQVDKVIDAWDTKRGNLKGYDGTIDPETPAGRVVELLHDLCRVRPNTTDVLEDRGAALKTIEANLRERGIELGDGDYPDVLVMAVSTALKERTDALQQVHSAERVLDGIRGGTLAPDFMAPLDTLGHRVLAAARALIDTAATMANTEAAARIRTAAADELRTAQNNPSGGVGDEFNAYLAGMEAAAHIAADEPAEADPSVAHIDTVNGRQRPAQATEPPGERYVDLAVTRDIEDRYDQ